MAPLLVGWGFCTAIAWLIGAGKGQAAGGFFFGLLLGPLGILLAAVGLKTSIAVQAQRDIDVEDEKARLRARLAELGDDQAPAQPIRTEIGRPPGK